MNSNFRERVSERFDENFFNVTARENETRLAKKGASEPSSEEILQYSFENLLITIPGAPLIYLYALTCESVATLRMRTQGKTEKIIESKDFWDTDFSPITRALEDGLPIKVQDSLNGIPIGQNGKGFDYLRPNEQ
ncbi:TPA: hypothetical protein DCZ36_03570 [Candidatus Gracilibacteria bacterium]|nr:hypothetical protein [Candidatus Gracilibacteria bacterium]